MVDESAGERWGRRALTFGGYALATAVVLGLLPLLLALALGRDLLLDRRLPLVRVLLFAAVYLVCETAGLLACAILWVVGLVLPEAARLELHQRLQTAWALALFGAVRALFGLRVTTGGTEAVAPGPVLVFIRHASIADTLLPAVLLTHRHGIRLRYLLKRELLWDPCLDVVGQRLPNAFLRRGSGDAGREIAAVRRLARGLGARDGVLVYPEGTRFTPAKLARRLAEIATSGDVERLARARRLRRVLPPRRGGPLALLDAASDADVLLVAHVGLEGIATVADALGGALIGRAIEVVCWRVPRAEIPADAAARARWLDDTWSRMDACVAAMLGESEPPQARSRAAE